MPKDTDQTKTIVVALAGGPSAGKSTCAAEVFALLKHKNVNCEMASEWVKEAAWENRDEVLQDQFYIYGNQHYRIQRLLGKVDVIITDAAPIMCAYYAAKRFNNNPWFAKMALHEHRKLNALLYFIERQKPYNPAGRWQNESEAAEDGEGIHTFLMDNSIQFTACPGTSTSAALIVKRVLEELEKLKSP